MSWVLPLAVSPTTATDTVTSASRSAITAPLYIWSSEAGFVTIHSKLWATHFWIVTKIVFTNLKLQKVFLTLLEMQ